jgi:hypothetical protein
LPLHAGPLPVGSLDHKERFAGIPSRFNEFVKCSRRTLVPCPRELVREQGGKTSIALFAKNSELVGSWKLISFHTIYENEPPETISASIQRATRSSCAEGA